MFDAGRVLARHRIALSESTAATTELGNSTEFPEAMTARVNSNELEMKVKDMYREVAVKPRGDFHFELARVMAERLGYDPADPDRVPASAIDSFAGVGHFFHLAKLQPGETVVDLGSGSGMDSFVAAIKVGPQGRVFGVDMTDA